MRPIHFRAASVLVGVNHANQPLVVPAMPFSVIGRLFANKAMGTPEAKHDTANAK